MALNIKQQFFRNSREINFTKSNITKNLNLVDSRRGNKKKTHPNPHNTMNHIPNPTTPPPFLYPHDTSHYTTKHIPKLITLTPQLKTQPLILHHTHDSPYTTPHKKAHNTLGISKPTPPRFTF